MSRFQQFFSLNPAHFCIFVFIRDKPSWQSTIYRHRAACYVNLDYSIVTPIYNTIVVSTNVLDCAPAFNRLDGTPNLFFQCVKSLYYFVLHASHRLLDRNKITKILVNFTKKIVYSLWLKNSVFIYSGIIIPVDVTGKYSKSGFEIRRWQRYCLHNLAPYRFSLFRYTGKKNMVKSTGRSPVANFTLA